MSTVRDVVVAGAGSACAVMCGARVTMLTAGGVATVDDLVVVAAAGLAAALGAWYALTALALLVAQVAARSGRLLPATRALGRVISAWGAPVLRRAAVVGTGAGLALGMTPAWAVNDALPPAVEAEALPGGSEALPLDLRPGFIEPAPSAHQAQPVAHEDAATTTPELEVEPEPAVEPAAEATPDDGPGIEARATVHVVQPGDSLWSIAAAALGPEADDAQIAVEWPRWYGTNRAALGSDPDLIHPGQELLAPDSKDSR